MPNREQVLEINSEQEDLARIGVSDASIAATIIVAGDTLAPAAPSSVSANAVPKGIEVEWANPSTNADGSICTDQRWARLYYGVTGASKAVYDGTYVTAAKQGTNSAFTDPNVGTGTDRYYVVTAMDANGNESAASSEVNSTGGGAGDLTEIPDDASGLIFDDTVGTEGVVVGDGILGVAFKQPASAWSNFDHYRLFYAVDANGGFGAWTEITPTNRIGYLHKGLTKTSSYRYKATIIAADGTESSTADKAKDDDTGYTPNGSNNSLIVAELVFAENIVATNEVRGEHFFAQSYLAINDTTFGNDGIQLEYNSGNPRAYIGDGSNAYVNFDGTKLTWKAANTELDASGNLVATSVTLTGAITATSGTIAGFTVHATDGLYAGATTTRVQMKPGAGFWAGATAQASAPFRVSAAGALVATSATITGAITASSGTIGGFTIGASALTAGSGGTAVGIAPASYPFYAGNATAASAPFRVSNAGALVATSATITGTITSSAVTITGGTLNINSGAFAVSAAGAMSCSSVAITGGTLSINSPVFTVSAAGALVASSATITGAITSSGVTITGGTLNIGSGAFTVDAAGAVACSALTVTGTSTWAGVDIGYGHIAANAVRAAELYIDGDINFKPDAVYHSITGLNRITYTAGYHLSVSEGTFYYGANYFLNLGDGEGMAFGHGLWPGILKIVDWADSGGAQGTAAGRIEVLTSTGYTRYIRLYT